MTSAPSSSAAGALGSAHDGVGAPWRLQPGPVALNPEVAAAAGSPAVSHRDPAFAEALAEVRQRLRARTGARRVAVLAGTGTHANDAVAAQLALAGGRGLVLSNGEFGERLADHARRAGLEFEWVRGEWGAPLDLDEGARRLRSAPLGAGGWVWACLCETSTGWVNDLDGLRALAAAAGARLVLDAVSAVGCVAVDLGGVALATAVSGKGLGAPAGLALVLAAESFLDGAGRVPACLDLARYEEVATTLPWGPLAGLRAALRLPAFEEDPARRRAGARVRRRLEDLGLVPLAGETAASPAVVTVPLPAEASSVEVGRALVSRGFLVSFQSEYLVRRNWVQLCAMGPAAPGEAVLVAAAEALGEAVQSAGTAAAPEASPSPPAPASPPAAASAA